MFKRILVANRGEIALRIIRACQEMGIESVAIFSEADRDAEYLNLADEAICIGTAKAADSYLKIDRVIAAAEVGNAQAIHPGYGFMAENADFAEVCQSCEIEFIGPSHEAMRMLGDKNESKRIARDANVPVVPGSPDLVKDVEEAAIFCENVGYPVLIKATAGGGGKGMRIAQDASSLSSAFEQATMEAQAAFGNSGVFIEKLIENPRHVEVQIIADKHGNVVHLWERDCSMQRRHQKLIEESPAPNLRPEVRQQLCDSAVRLIKAANYSNAGTIEYLVDKDQNFYFIEVNARIQVEHPVSELVTGIDLIKEQIRVAAGEELPFTQDDIPQIGAAIECRINAEDPSKNFLPSPGKIEEIFIPGGRGVRWDSHVRGGYSIPPHYDSMIGKLLVHGKDRDEAITIMLRALKELRVKGISTTRDRLIELIDHSTFREGTVDTTFIERNWKT